MRTIDGKHVCQMRDRRSFERILLRLRYKLRLAHGCQPLARHLCIEEVLIDPRYRAIVGRSQARLMVLHLIQPPAPIESRRCLRCRWIEPDLVVKHPRCVAEKPLPVTEPTRTPMSSRGCFARRKMRSQIAV